MNSRQKRRIASPTLAYLFSELKISIRPHGIELRQLYTCCGNSKVTATLQQCNAGRSNKNFSNSRGTRTHADDRRINAADSTSFKLPEECLHAEECAPIIIADQMTREPNWQGGAFDLMLIRSDCNLVMDAA